MRTFIVMNVDNGMVFDGVFSTKELAMSFIRGERRKNKKEFQIFETLLDYNSYVQMTRVKNV